MKKLKAERPDIFYERGPSNESFGGRTSDKIDTYRNLWNAIKVSIDEEMIEAYCTLNDIDLSDHNTGKTEGDIDIVFDENNWLDV